jgi:hypothetical protein
MKCSSEEGDERIEAASRQGVDCEVHFGESLVLKKNENPKFPTRQRENHIHEHTPNKKAKDIILTTQRTTHRYKQEHSKL